MPVVYGLPDKTGNRGRSVTLSFKIGCTIVLVLAAALSLTTLLNYLRFDETLQQLLEQRMHVVLAEARRDMLTGLDLGLRLENMENLSGGLRKHLQVDNDIRAIEVFDCAGNPITRVTNQGEGTERPLAFAVPDKDDWYRMTPHAAVVGSILRDSVGQCAGYVRLVASNADYLATRSKALTQLWRAAAFAMAAAVPVLILLWVLMRLRHRLFVDLEDDLDHALAGEAPVKMRYGKAVLTRAEGDMVAEFRQIRDILATAMPEDEMAKLRAKGQTVPSRDGGPDQ
jgi:hypothetical protein